MWRGSARWPGRLSLVALFMGGAIVGAPSGFGIFLFSASAPASAPCWRSVGRESRSVGSWSGSAGLRHHPNPAAGTPSRSLLGSTRSPPASPSSPRWVVPSPSTCSPCSPSSSRRAKPRRPMARLDDAGTRARAGSAGRGRIHADHQPRWQGTSGVSVRNPWAILPELPLWRAVTPDTVVLLLVALMIGAAISLFVRFRRAVDVERQQLRWITAALAFVALAVVGGFVLGLVIPISRISASSGWEWSSPSRACRSPWLAVSRYRLYEIDRIISRSISWAVVTVSARTRLRRRRARAAGCAGTTDRRQHRCRRGLHPGRRGTLSAAPSTHPASGRPTFRPGTYDGERTAAAFAARLRDQVDLESLEAELGEVVRRTVAPTTLGLWIQRQEARE